MREPRMRVVTIGAEDVRIEKEQRLFKCPKCGRWNPVGHQHLMQKVFVVTCNQCGTRYRPK